MAAVELPALYIDNVALVVATSRPLLINRDPAPEELDVPLDTAVGLELVDPGPDGIDRSATRVWVDGVLAFEGGAAEEVKPPFAGALAGATQTADTLRVVLHPLLPFASEADVSVRVVSRTSSEAHAIDETYSFHIEDRTAPRLVGALATGPRAVRLSFDEPVLLPTGANLLLVPRGTPAVSVAVTSTSMEGEVLTLGLDMEMTPDVLYEVRAVGVTDRYGNAVLGPYDRALFSGFRPARPPSRRFDLWQMLPKHNRRDDLTGDLFRFIACLQEVADLLLADIDRWPDIFDLERAPEPFVDLILQDLGNPFSFELDLLAKRRLASLLVEMYHQKGTAKGIRNAVRFFLGIELQAIAPFASDTLTLGESELGIDWVLGPSDRFARYAFNIEVGRILTPTERKQLRAIVEYLKPAHTHFVDLVEPLPPILPDHWELGLSDLGETTDLH
ncbi:phage tail protein [Archangium violaceum]|uniref:phage tail protein n=1 Tax=Archangium violaceum TaxID=83451 RepID=UPI00193B044F|nr:phage tail protein [Archangium violaceum]QRK08576.1 phage tail protein [Archangium violaceum]